MSLLGRTLPLLRVASPPRALRSHLRRLRAISQRAQRELHERRRKTRAAQHDQTATTTSAFASSSSSDGETAGLHVDMLPRNDALESAVAFAISENRDARTELEFTRHFLSSSLLSLAAPVGPWDPYDVKPQVFALDNYLALPVFSSMEYLRLFCRRFRFTVRDPSGVLWADGNAEDRDSDGETHPPLPDVRGSVWWERHVRLCTQTHALEAPRPAVLPSTMTSTTTTATTTATASLPREEVRKADGTEAEETECKDWPNADALFEVMDTDGKEPDMTTTPKAAKAGKGRTPRTRTRRQRAKHQIKRKRRRTAAPKASTPRDGMTGASPIDSAAHEAFWAKVRATSPFSIRQATPLPAFGPPLRPFFVGYFADVDTLLHNAAIVPEKVDIVLNPSSPIEFVLAREATDRVLHRDQLLLLAYRRVERALRGEFHRFFQRHCAEVVWARSACVPCPIPGAPDAVRYEIVILIESDTPVHTFARVRAAKRECVLMGHADLDVVPWQAAAPHVRDASTPFYTRPIRAKAKRTSGATGNGWETQQGRESVEEVNRSGKGVFGVFEARGPVRTIHVSQSPDSYYHDPSAIYTESHAVFTEEIKLRR